MSKIRLLSLQEGRFQLHKIPVVRSALLNQHNDSLSGLGAATVKLMSSLGASIAVFDLQLPAGSSDSQKHRYFKVDVSKTEQVATAVKAVAAWSKETNKPIAAVVCCAGFLGPAKVRSHFLPFT